MSRQDVTPTVSTAVQLPAVTLVLMGRLDILGDPVIAWTGPGTFLPVGSGDAALDGFAFAPLAPFISLSEVQEDQGIGGPTTIVLTGQDLDEEALLQVVNDKRIWQGRKAYLWLGVLDTDEFTVLPNPVRIKTGVMTQMRTNRSSDAAVVSVTIDMDLGRATGVPFRWIEHTRIYPADTYSTYIVKLANKPSGITKDRNPVDDFLVDPSERFNNNRNRQRR